MINLYGLQKSKVGLNVQMAFYCMNLQRMRENVFATLVVALWVTLRLLVSYY